MRLRPTVAIFTSLALALGGCSATLDYPSAEPTIGVISAEDLQTYSFPLDPYLDAGGPGFGVEAQAYRILFDRCMSRFGFDASPTNRLGPSHLEIRTLRYGLADLDLARQHGYHVPIQEVESDQTSNQPRSEAYAAVASGNSQDRSHNGLEIPEGGCAGEARRTLDEGAPTVDDSTLGQALTATAFQRAEQDSRMIAAFDAWSECMSAAGFDYADPWEPNDNPAFGGPDATPEEIAVATADVTCKIEVDLINTWIAVETAYQQQLLDENAEALQEVLEMLEVRRRNAAQVVAG